MLPICIGSRSAPTVHGFQRAVTGRQPVFWGRESEDKLFFAPSGMVSHRYVQQYLTYRIRYLVIPGNTHRNKPRWPNIGTDFLQDMGGTHNENGCYGKVALVSSRRNVPVDASLGVNPFRTAVPFCGQTSQILSNLSSTRNCGPKTVNTVPVVEREPAWKFDTGRVISYRTCSSRYPIVPGTTAVATVLVLLFLYIW